MLGVLIVVSNPFRAPHLESTALNKDEGIEATIQGLGHSNLASQVIRVSNSRRVSICRQLRLVPRRTKLTVANPGNRHHEHRGDRQLE